jgi:putative membrane protein
LKRTTQWQNLIFASALLVSNAAVAQIPGGGAPTGQTPPTIPNQRPDSNMPAPSDGTANSMSSRVDDNKFIKEAALGGMAEVELGKLAVQKASNDNVKQFAQKMIDDHSKANDKLKEVASRDKITVPESLDSKHQARIDKLAKLSGDQFDKAYVKDQLKDHENDVDKFSAEAQGGSDPAIKDFAASTLPTLKQHLDLVKSLHKSQKS